MKFPLPIIRAAALAALLLAEPEAGAQLYKKTAPPGSAFVRICNGTANAGVTSRVGDRVEPQLPPFSMTDYLFVPPGPQVIQINGQEQTYTLEGDHFYTVAYTGAAQKLFDLKGFESQFKAMVVFINLLADTTLSLKTADGKTAVFADVPAVSATQREVNPFRVTLAIFAGDRKLADAPPVSFERGKVSSLIIGGTAAVPTLSWQTQE